MLEGPKLQLRKGCRLFLIAMIEKLQDRVPLKSAIGKYSSCLGPHNMINHKDVCILKSKKPLEKLCKNNSMTPVEADNSKNDFPNILTLAQQHQEKFDFIHSLQNLQFQIQDNTNTWKICPFIFALSHGQSQVERSFNINKNTLQENLPKKCFGGRIVYGILIDSDKSDFVTTNELILNYKSVFSKHNELTKEKK